MKSEETRNGVRIRKHFATSTKISEDGLFVEKEFIDKQDGNKLKTYNPKIKVDEKGLRYIENKSLGGATYRTWLRIVSVPLNLMTAITMYWFTRMVTYRMTTIKTLNGGLQLRPIHKLRLQQRVR